MARKYLIYVFWSVCAFIILFLSFKYDIIDSSTAILAEVEPQKYAVSFQRAVKVREVFVIPGQQVKKGDKLIRVERPELVLEAQRKEILLAALKSEHDRKTIEKNNRLAQAKMSDDLRKLKLDLEIEQVNMTMAANKNLSENFAVMQLWNDTSVTMEQPLMKLRQKQLEDEKGYLDKQLKVETLKIEQVYAIEVATLQNEITQLEKEIEVLRREEFELTQYAHIDGTIGNISVEIQELAPPYTTLLSIYEINPTIIRALVNEQMSLRIASGDSVVVESTNRSYKTKGKVMEIGSRIIEYPSRLRQFTEVPVWGREIFIKIPIESRFLNGEKVFVIVNKKNEN